MLLLTIFLNAQEEVLVIEKLERQKVRVIPEHKRIQVVTNQDQKIRGRFTIIDEKTIEIKGEQFKLADLIFIRRSPQFDAIMTIVNLVWIGGWSLVGGIAGVIPLYIALPVSGVMTYSMFDPPNLNKRYSIHKNWKFRIDFSKK